MINVPNRSQKLWSGVLPNSEIFSLYGKRENVKDDRYKAMTKERVFDFPI